MQYVGEISKMAEWSLSVSKANHLISQWSKFMPNQQCWRSWCWMFYEDLQDFLELMSKIDVLIIIRDWNGKVRSQEIPGVTGNFGLVVQKEAGQRLTEFCQENALVIATTLFQQHKRRLCTWSHHQVVNIKIRLMIFFAAKDRETLYSQQEQDQELTVAPITNFLLQNSDLNRSK